MEFCEEYKHSLAALTSVGITTSPMANLCIFLARYLFFFSIFFLIPQLTNGKYLITEDISKF